MVNIMMQPIKSIKEKISDTFDQKHDELAGRAIRRTLDYGGSAVLEIVEDPYMPWVLRRHLHVGYYMLYARFAEDMEKELQREFFRSTDFKRFRDHRFDFWPTAPSLLAGFRQPAYELADAVAHMLRALRARFLYAENPADGSTWKVLRDPLGLLLLVLKLHRVTSVACFGLLFVLMDRRDEYQLVRFILKFKTVMVLTSGVTPLVMLGLRTHGCIVAVVDGEGVADACVSNAASSSPFAPWLFGCELVRLLLIWTAFGLLVSGHAYGGDEQREALEHVRLDAADGTLDGVINIGAPAVRAGTNERAARQQRRAGTASRRRLNKQAAQAAPSSQQAEDEPAGGGPSAASTRLATPGRAVTRTHGATHGATPRSLHVDDGLARLAVPSEYRPAIEQQAVQRGAVRRHGGVLPYFLAYDVCMLLGMLLLWVLMYAAPRWPLDTRDPIFWSSLYNLRTSYGLLSFPFLVFEVPFVDLALHRAVPTAYDQSGLLVTKLTKYQVAIRYKQDLATRVIQRHWKAMSAGGGGGVDTLAPPGQKRGLWSQAGAAYRA